MSVSNPIFIVSGIRHTIIGYERIFYLFFGLYYIENQWGCSIPFNIAMKVMKALDGYNGEIEIYDANFYRNM
ncbi:MAG: hypothetical protein ACUVWP_01310 [bacterium]